KPPFTGPRSPFKRFKRRQRPHAIPASQRATQSRLLLTPPAVLPVSQHRISAGPMRRIVDSYAGHAADINMTAHKRKRVSNGASQDDELSAIAAHGAKLKADRIRMYLSDSDNNDREEEEGGKPDSKRARGLQRTKSDVYVDIHRRDTKSRVASPQLSMRNSSSKYTVTDTQTAMISGSDLDSESNSDSGTSSDSDSSSEADHSSEDQGNQNQAPGRQHNTRLADTTPEPSTIETDQGDSGSGIDASETADDNQSDCEESQTTYPQPASKETVSGSSSESADNTEQSAATSRLRQRRQINYAVDLSFNDLDGFFENPADQDKIDTRSRLRRGHNLRGQPADSNGESLVGADDDVASEGEASGVANGAGTSDNSDSECANQDKVSQVVKSRPRRGGKNAGVLSPRRQLRSTTGSMGSNISPESVGCDDITPKITARKKPRLKKGETHETPISEASGTRYTLRNRNRRVSYRIPSPLLESPSQIRTSLRKQNDVDRLVDEHLPQSGPEDNVWAAVSKGCGPLNDPNLGPRGENQAAGNDELEMILPMNMVELGAERCYKAGYVNDAMFADSSSCPLTTEVSFNDVGGLDDYVRSLKEMVVLPLVYPEISQSFGIKPPRGVLFHGPPGTGKTLMARALAQSCSMQKGGQPIAFFMRRGADCLSKWVGEAERQLRHLFEQAKAFQPSIIFFDELDGLAPVRSSRQDQVHASIVATLLALMDGIDDRGQVIVIGATNRPDSIDPALRRPGRFDREMLFRLPGTDARRSIVRIHTRKWLTPLSETDESDIVECTQGWGGADIGALCTEAVLAAVRRSFPQIYDSPERLNIDTRYIKVGAADLRHAMRAITPSTKRSGSSGISALSRALEPLMSGTCEGAAAYLRSALTSTAAVFRPRVAVYGRAGMGVGSLGAAVAYAMEACEIPVFVLSAVAMFRDADATPATQIARLFAEAQRKQPSLVFIPMAHRLTDVLDENTIALLDQCIDDLSMSDRIGVLVSAEAPRDCQPPRSNADDDCELVWQQAMPEFARQWFVEIVSPDSRVCATMPTAEQRDAFFAPLFGLIGSSDMVEPIIEPLDVAPIANSLALEQQLSPEENSVLNRLRHGMTAVLRLARTKPVFKNLLTPVSAEAHPLFYSAFANPVFLSTIEDRIAARKYLTVAEFIDDFKMIGKNTLTYFEQTSIDITSNSSEPITDHLERDQVYSELYASLKIIGKVSKNMVVKCIDLETIEDSNAIAERRNQDIGLLGAMHGGRPSVNGAILGSSVLRGGVSIGLPSPPLLHPSLDSASRTSSFDSASRNDDSLPAQAYSTVTAADDADGVDAGSSGKYRKILEDELKTAASRLTIESLESLRVRLVAEASNTVEALLKPDRAFKAVVNALRLWQGERERQQRKR
ncbi:TAT-binding protein-like protein 7, AAA ATPase, partial [Kickxella alabastrina]